jgi:hypothetical protein
MIIDYLQLAEVRYDRDHSNSDRLLILCSQKTDTLQDITRHEYS